MGHTMGFSFLYGLQNVLPRPRISSDTPTGPNVLRNLTPAQFCWFFRGFGPSPSFSSQPIFVSDSLCLSVKWPKFRREPKAQRSQFRMNDLLSLSHCASYHAFYTDANAGSNLLLDQLLLLIFMRFKTSYFGF